MTGIEPLLIAASLLVLFGVIASKLSDRLGIPALVLFIGVGMLAGSEGPGGIEFTDFAAAQNLGIVALAYILYAGGLSTPWGEIRPVLRSGISLATVGVVITAVLSGAVAAWALDLPLMTGLLLGAIISSTDAAAVFSVLGSRSVALRNRVTPLLELESGSNDPMAAFLTIGLIELILEPERSIVRLLLVFFQQMALGMIVGLLIAVLTVAAVNRLRLEHDGLYPVITMSVVVLTYGTAAAIGGSGFLAVYVAGIFVGNSELLHRKSLIRFHDALAWLCQIAMFLVLGLLVAPSRLFDAAGRALFVAIALVLLARPAAVLVGLAASRFSFRERAMVSWVGLRGAVPIILATFPLVAQIDGAELMFDVVFFTVLVSVLVQATTIPTVARLLRVEAPLVKARPYPLEAVSTGHGDATLHELEVHPRSVADGASLLELALPAGSLIVMVSRDQEFLVPEGGTRLSAGDTVLVLADDDQLRLIRDVVEPRITGDHDAVDGPLDAEGEEGPGGQSNE